MEEAEKTTIRETLDRIRPQLQADGGDLELVSIEEDGTVKVKLQGACAGCPGAQMTLQFGVERILKEVVPNVKGVVAV
ncbi:MAG TPA: NifU family protein [Planctomycetota bacterium]|nr:NifU family protein [Planctomycetota bacterium]